VRDQTDGGGARADGADRPANMSFPGSVRRHATAALKRLEPTVLASRRALARLRLGRLARDGVTLLTVNWNAGPCLETLLEAVDRFTEPGALDAVVVIDNHSTDGSEAPARRRPGTRLIRLPVNAGHAAALDFAVLGCRTEYFVVLDVDAFPIAPGWLDLVLKPLQAGATIAGAHVHRPHAHPCWMAMRVERFVRESHSFKPYRPWDVELLGSERWDVGERLSMVERERGGSVHLIERTEVRGPGDVGSVFGDAVYHNFYGARFATTTLEILDGVVSRDDPRLAWDEAVRRWLS